MNTDYCHYNHVYRSNTNFSYSKNWTYPTLAFGMIPRALRGISDEIQYDFVRNRFQLYKSGFMAPLMGLKGGIPLSLGLRRRDTQRRT